MPSRRGIELGVEAVNRYENHLINTGWQAVDMIERVGADNIFVHLDTYHMNIEEKGAANGILDAREHLKYIHLSESDRGTPGYGNCPGTRSTRRSRPSASRADWRWKASSTCRRKSPTAWPCGARSPRTRRKSWAMACRSCATRRSNTVSSDQSRHGIDQHPRRFCLWRGKHPFAWCRSQQYGLHP